MTAKTHAKRIVTITITLLLLSNSITCNAESFFFGCIIGNISENKSHVEIVRLFQKDARNELINLGITTNFEVLIDDAEGSPYNHLEKIQGLNAMGVVPIVGGDTDSMSQMSLNYINSQDLLLISPLSNGLDLAIPDDNLFRLTPPITVQSKVIVEALEAFGINYLIILRSSEDWTQVVDEGIRDGFKGTAKTIRYENTQQGLQEADENIESKSNKYQVDEIGVLLLGSTGLPNLLNQIDEYRYLSSVPWFGTTETVTNSLISDTDQTILDKVKLFSPTPACMQSIVYDELNERVIQETGEPLTFSQACVHDALNIHFVSLLATGIYDAEVMKENIPIVSSIFFGASGWCILDENGDRLITDYSIQGYNQDTGFTEYARYNGIEETITWDDKINQLDYQFPIRTSLTCTTKENPTTGDPIAIEVRLAPSTSNAQIHFVIWDDGSYYEEKDVTLSTGRYTYLLMAEEPGNWNVEVSYPGNDIYIGSEANTSFNVLQESKISCSLNDTEISIGNSIIISGKLVPKIPEVNVTISIDGPDNTNSIEKNTTILNGNYILDFTPTKTGVYEIRASWPGNVETWSDKSELIILEVKKLDTNLQMGVNNDSLLINQDAIVTTTIHPIPQYPEITVSVENPDGTNQSIQCSLDENGQHKEIVNLEMIGEWKFQAIWSGDDNYTSTQTIVHTIFVSKKESSIEISSINQSLVVDEKLVINGKLIPELITGIELTITCNDTVNSLYEVTASTGEYMITFNPDKIGTYQAKAKWQGNNTHKATESNTHTFEVLPPQIGYLTVKVLDQNENPIQDANITIVHLDIAGETMEVFTDSEGYALLGELPMGNYEVSSQVNDYRTEYSTIQVGFREDVAITMNMKKKGVLELVSENQYVVTGVVVSAALAIYYMFFKK